MRIRGLLWARICVESVRISQITGLVRDQFWGLLRLHSLGGRKKGLRVFGVRGYAYGMISISHLGSLSPKP